jgi:hypothetical protein
MDGLLSSLVSPTGLLMYAALTHQECVRLRPGGYPFHSLISVRGQVPARKISLSKPELHSFGRQRWLSGLVFASPQPFNLTVAAYHQNISACAKSDTTDNRWL